MRQMAVLAVQMKTTSSTPFSRCKPPDATVRPREEEEGAELMRRGAVCVHLHDPVAGRMPNRRDVGCHRIEAAIDREIDAD